MNGLESFTVTQIVDELSHRYKGVVLVLLSDLNIDNEDDFLMFTRGGTTVCVGLTQRAAAITLRESLGLIENVEEEEEESGDE